MDDGAALVREVLEELPMEDKGEREEWKLHQGWHRREDTHRMPRNLRLSSKGHAHAKNPDASMGAHFEQPRKERVEEAEEEHLLPPTAIDIDVEEEAAIKQKIHEDLIANEGVVDEKAATKITSSVPRASVTKPDDIGAKQPRTTKLRSISLSQEEKESTPSPQHPNKGERASRPLDVIQPHLRGSAVLLPRSQDYPEEHPFGLLWSSSWIQLTSSSVEVAIAVFVFCCCCIMRQSCNNRGRLKRHRG